MKLIILINIFLFSLKIYASPNDDCHSWPMSMGQVFLKNNGLISQISDLRKDKTVIKMLASEKRKDGYYNNVFYFKFFDEKEKAFDIITQNLASDDECSITGVNVYLISKKYIEKITDNLIYSR